MTNETKRTWAEVSLGAIEHNYREMRSKLGPDGRFLGVVKANAYGHGAIRVSLLLQELGADYLAVACFDEALELRINGIKLPILILGYTPPYLARDLAKLGITPALGSLEAAREMAEALKGTGLSLNVHIKLDSGMGRMGFCAASEASLDEAVAAMALEGIEAEGVFTHFAVSDVLGDKYTDKQFERFTKAIDYLEAKRGERFAIRHCTNSGAMINYPHTYLDMVRPGISLYGLYPDKDRGDIVLKPAMTLKSRIARVFDLAPGDSVSYGRTFIADRPTRAAVVTIGYADGLHRVLSNKMDMLIGGRRVKQIGRICMDMCMADVTELEGVTVGDEAVIFGGELSVDEQAQKAGTISYELLCAVAPRVPRVYTD